MEYPKFGGSLRAYNTFKRDFLEIIEASNQFSPSQMSLLLRNECLQGPPKLLVASIYEYEDIWEKLNEVYDDEGQVVQAITRQILTYKEIPEDDMNGFVEYVEMIEKAYFDLRAYKSTDVLANPVTIQCIMDKCPYWVQQVLTRDMTRMGIPREQEYDFIRKSMVELKKQARKLSKLSSKKPRNHDNKGRGGPRGLVNTAEGEVIAAEVPGVGVATVNFAAGGRPPLPSSSGWKCYDPGTAGRSKPWMPQAEEGGLELQERGRGTSVPQEGVQGEGDGEVSAQPGCGAAGGLDPGGAGDCGQARTSP